MSIFPVIPTSEGLEIRIDKNGAWPNGKDFPGAMKSAEVLTMAVSDADKENYIRAVRSSTYCTEIVFMLNNGVAFRFISFSGSVEMELT